MKKIYSIRDTKIGTYMTPMFVPHLTTILRDLEEVIKDEKSMLNKHPEDFELRYIGEFDEETGEIELEITPKFIENMTNIKKGVENATS